MKNAFELIVYEEGDAGILYSIHFAGEDLCELDRFLTNPEYESHPQFADVEDFLFEMVDSPGFYSGFFKTEKYPPTFGYPAYALSDKSRPRPVKSLRLRLFCSIWNESIMIAGGGCIKPPDKRKLQDVLACKNAYKRLVYAFQRLDERVQAGDVRVTDEGFIGNLHFEADSLWRSRY